MNTEALIHDLVIECRQVRPLRGPGTRFLIWAFLTSLILAIGVIILRPSDYSNIPLSFNFVLATIVIVGVSVTTAIYAFVLTVPRIRGVSFFLGLAVALFCLFGLMAYLLVTGDLSNTQPGYLCIERIVMLSVLPAILLFYMLHKAAPLKPGAVGLLGLLSVLLSACLSLGFVCSKAMTLNSHVLVWHILPVSVLSSIGFFAGRLLSPWGRRG